MSKQFSFVKNQKLVHGGALVKGHAKHARPLCSKRPIHLVIKSSKATGAKSFLSPRYKMQIERILRQQASTFGIKVYNYANGGNHLHLAIRIMNHQLFKKFIRAVTGLIARLMTSAQKGKAGREKFFDARPFTRIVTWGKAYEYLKSYFALNNLEALGFIAYQDRTNKRRRLLSITIEPFVMSRG